MPFPYTYGLYTGQLWTGGVYVNIGERGNFIPDPIDASDNYARTHDWRFANADDSHGV
jgi:hypothetical protein